MKGRGARECYSLSVVVGDRIREQTAIAPYIYPMTLLDQRDEYLLPHSPSRSLWFLCENGRLRRDRTTDR